jgi:hypothetical protein
MEKKKEKKKAVSQWMRRSCQGFWKKYYPL